MDPRYPIGKYEPRPFSETQKEEWLSHIRFLPQAIEEAVRNLDEDQLQTPYREGGWTVHQVVHHVADSHMNAFIRFKLGLTEESPIIKPYNEGDWVKTRDVENLPINISITLLFALHLRWSELLVQLNNDDWQRTVIHPDHKEPLTLWHLLGMYAWHSLHHTAHITVLREQKGW